MKEILKCSELMLGQKYLAFNKGRDLEPKTISISTTHGWVHGGEGAEKMWCMPENNQLMDRYRLFGPVFLPTLEECERGLIATTEIVDDTTRTKTRVNITTSGGSVYVEVEGMTTATEEDGAVIMLSSFDSEIGVRVWADVNQEDYTCKVDLEGAKKENYEH